MQFILEDKMKSKKCSKCKAEKEISCFYKNKARYDGLCNFCKECDKGDRRTERRKKQYREEYLAKNKESIKKYHQDRYKDNKNLYYERNKKWAAENKDRYRELWSRYYRVL